MQLQSVPEFYWYCYPSVHVVAALCSTSPPLECMHADARALCTDFSSVTQHFAGCSGSGAAGVMYLV